MMTITLWLGAEGCAELENETWLREATEEEIEAFREEWGQPGFDDLKLDGIGRPYFLMTVTEDAPEWALGAARSNSRRVRLE